MSLQSASSEDRTQPGELDLPHWNMGRYSRQEATVRRSRAARRVLVADDDGPLGRSLVQLLADIGYTVVGLAHDGNQAIEMSRRYEPDVVLMDLRMPGVDGIAATAAIREALPHIKVVVLSAYDDPALQRDARRAGAYAYLPKGVSLRTIDQTLVAASDDLN